MKVLVAANNPGGANAILSVIGKLNDFVAIAEDKAKDYFVQENINFVDGNKITDEEIKKIFEENNFDLFLAGTSMGETIDKRLLLECKKRNIKSVYVLDFWVNYWQRFSSQNNKDFKYLPDYICVMDEKAKTEMVAEGFDAKKLIVTGNPYFDHFTDGITSDKEDKDLILFASQPLQDLDYPFDEFSVLQDVIDVLPTGKKLIIRLHPREQAGKFDDVLNNKAEYDIEQNINESISRAGVVVGMNSMVLFQAALAGKNVISYQPGLKQKDSLISNDLRVSQLVKTRDELAQALTKYFEPNIKKSNVVIKNATDNVVNFINKIR